MRFFACKARWHGGSGGAFKGQSDGHADILKRPMAVVSSPATDDFSVKGGFMSGMH